MIFLNYRKFLNSKKRSIGEYTGKESLYTPIPEFFRKILDLKKKFEESTNYPGLKVNHGKIEFPNRMIEGLFSESIDEIKEHVGRLSAQISVDAIILVGGFSESKLIYKSMKESFESIKILNPDECGISVLKGAVLYGLQPQQIAKRVSRYSYGFSIRKPFDPEVHLMHILGNKLEDVFCPIILAGEIVVANEVREYRCRVAYSGLIKVEFCGTWDTNLKYVNGCENFKPEFPCLHSGDIVGKY